MRKHEQPVSAQEFARRMEQAAIARVLDGYEGFGGLGEPPRGVTTVGSAYAAPRLVISREFVRRDRIGGREMSAWGLAFALAVSNVAGAIAWVTR